MQIVGIVQSKRWMNRAINCKISFHEAFPWATEEEKKDWELIEIGYNWVLDNGVIGLGRKTASTEEEAHAVMKSFNQNLDK